MNQGSVLDLGRQGVEVALMVSLPILAVTLFLGLLVSVFQAVTQVQEMTLTFVPKLVGVAIILAFMGNWMLTTLVQFMHLCFERASMLGA
ncbi:MAG: flagellar biosynthetic protein FliQ [Armatimonadetes bacterium 55-13]|nr:flagellar biosynthesis protein FliQ [Armatimonadota bacterium]OJU65455.1 MAG: flagellar biosynthetic protein FliQ [Armatimonadetes bacterium 55-13]